MIAAHPNMRHYFEKVHTNCLFLSENHAGNHPVYHQDWTPIFSSSRRQTANAKRCFGWVGSLIVHDKYLSVLGAGRVSAPAMFLNGRAARSPQDHCALALLHMSVHTRLLMGLVRLTIGYRCPALLSVHRTETTKHQSSGTRWRCQW